MIVSQETVEVLRSISLSRARLFPTLYVVLTFHFLMLCFWTAVQMTLMNMESEKERSYLHYWRQAHLAQVNLCTLLKMLAQRSLAQVKESAQEKSYL